MMSALGAARITGDIVAAQQKKEPNSATSKNSGSSRKNLLTCQFHAIIFEEVIRLGWS